MQKSKLSQLKHNCAGAFVKYFTNKNSNFKIKVVIRITLYAARKLRNSPDRLSLFGESGHLNRIEYVGDRMGVAAGKARHKVRHTDTGKQCLKYCKSLCVHKNRIKILSLSSYP